MPYPSKQADTTVAPTTRATISDEQWNDWRWHMRKRINTAEKARQWINLTTDEEKAMAETDGKYRWSITPYYASLMDPDDPLCPVRQQAVPALSELMEYSGADIDPVGDMFYRKTNRVVHKYPDRVILLVTEACPVYCRHCTRKFHTTDVDGTYFEKNEGENLDDDLRYIADHPEIRDVLLTGGDPLSYRDDKLEEIISGLRAIPSVEIIRIGCAFRYCCHNASPTNCARCSPGTTLSGSTPTSTTPRRSPRRQSGPSIGYSGTAFR